MKDEPDDGSEENCSAADEGATSESVPQDAKWDLVVQLPVERGNDQELTATIVAAIADAEGLSPRDVKSPPLYDVVDTAALEEAFFGPENGSRYKDPNSSTEFMYRGFRVVVQSNGWVSVYERAE